MPWPPTSGPVSLLAPAALAHLELDGRWVDVDRDEVLVRQGARSDQVHVVADGRFRVVVTTRGGRSVLLEVAGPGQLLGELAAIDGGPRSATVSALEPARTLSVPNATFRRVVREDPRAAWALLESLAGRLRAADRRFVGVAAEVTGTRVARRLLEIAAEHGSLVEDGLRLDLPLSQEELASWVGASREGVSQALGELRRNGVIDTARMAITIRDVPALRELADV